MSETVKKADRRQEEHEPKWIKRGKLEMKPATILKGTQVRNFERKSHDGVENRLNAES